MLTVQDLSGLPFVSGGHAMMRHQHTSAAAFGVVALSCRGWRRHSRESVVCVRNTACVMAVDLNIECGSRLRGDPEALERWLQSVGGSIGPVVLEGKFQVFKQGKMQCLVV